MDNKLHRYFPDFYVKLKNKQDIIEELIIEVKPEKETRPPKALSGTKPSKRYLTEVSTWGVNSAKWQAADAYCKDRGWKFVTFTEKDIFGK